MVSHAGRPSSSSLQQWSRSLQPRHVIVGCCFLATFTAYVERVGFSIAFTALARQVGSDEQVKGFVMSSFYWGYGVSQVRRGTEGASSHCHWGIDAARARVRARRKLERRAPSSSPSVLVALLVVRRLLTAPLQKSKKTTCRSRAAGPRRSTAGARPCLVRSSRGRC